MFQYVRVTQRTVSTYCRICEPLCGMIATVEDGRLISLRPDDQHPLSQGYACPKGLAFPEVQDDPDRVLHPLRRVPGGLSRNVFGSREGIHAARPLVLQNLQAEERPGWSHAL